MTETEQDIRGILTYLQEEKISVEELEKYSKHENIVVKISVFMHENCPVHTLEEAFNSTNNPGVWGAIADNKNTPARVLMKMTQKVFLTDNYWLCKYLISNPNTPKEYKELLRSYQFLRNNYDTVN
jgi:hypothetical protein